MTCDEATSSIGSDKRIITMDEELKLMKYNGKRRSLAIFAETQRDVLLPREEKA